MRLLLILAIMAAGLVCRAGDITRGQDFVNGQRITAAQLHALVDSAIINPTFFTGQSGGTSNLVDTDTILTVGGGVFIKKLGSGFLRNNLLITEQTEKITVATNDYVLIYDAAADLLKKASLGNISLNNTNIINGSPLIYSNLLTTARVLVLNDSTNNSVTLSNMYWLTFNYDRAFTNLTALSTLTNADLLLVAHPDSTGTNWTVNKLSIAGLYTNPPTITVLTNTDTVDIFSTATNASPGVATNFVAKTTLLTLLSYVSNTIAPLKFTSSETTIAVGNFLNIAHGMSNVISGVSTTALTPDIVRLVFVCKTNATYTGYATNDEVAAESVFYQASGDNKPAFAYGANSTNVFATAYFPTASNLRIAAKTNATGVDVQFLAAHWAAKIYAIYHK